jgi:polyhydroxybutyrate depolymerase
MKALRICALALAVIAASAALAAQGRAQAGNANGLMRQTWTVDGVERSALTAAPRGSASNATVPLVFVFHGHGGSSANAARTFRIHEAWPEALVIYPQGLPNVGQITDPEGKQPGWQHVSGGEGDRDLHLVDAMFAWATKTYPVDKARVFAAGHSNGGSMVYLLWSVQSDRFAAFAPSSSVFRIDALMSAKPKPAFIVTGQKDALVPFVAQQLSLRGVLRLNGAAADAAAWSGGATKHASPSGADVITYIHPGGHPMPDDAGTLIVKFFKSVAGSLPRVSAAAPAPRHSW